MLLRWWPVIAVVLAQVAALGAQRADIATLKRQVDVLYRYELWGQRPNVGPPPPLQ